MSYKEDKDDGAKVTISRAGMSSDPEKNDFYIEIEDSLSGNAIVRVKMTAQGFAMAVTGLGNTSARYDYVVDEMAASDLRKMRVVKSVCCEKTGYNKDEQKAEVLRHFNENYINEWRLKSYGTTTQQHGKKHNYVIVKYVEVPG